jgi:hypothetical protein
VIARIEHDRVLLDLRTVAPEDDAALLRVLTALGNGDSHDYGFRASRQPPR